MNLSRYEQETIVRFNEEEATAGVYTHNRALARKLRQLSETRPEECRIERIHHGGQAVDYTIPKAWVRINPTRIISEEQRAAMAERLMSNLRQKPPITIGNSEPESGEEGNYIPEHINVEREA